MKDFQSTINRGLKNLRTKLGLSQEKFAERCKMNSDNYRNLEYNRYTPKAVTIDKICSEFNISVVELLELGAEEPLTNRVKRITDKLIDLPDNKLELIEKMIEVISNYSE